MFLIGSSIFLITKEIPKGAITGLTITEPTLNEQVPGEIIIKYKEGVKGNGN